MRVLLRVLAPVLGLALTVAGVLLALEVVAEWTRLDPDQGGVLVPWPQWQATLSDLRWTSFPVSWIGIGVGVVGLLLLLVAFTARRAALRVDAPTPAMTVMTSPRVLARMVGKRVRRTDDVAAASVTASRRRVTVSMQMWGDPTEDDGKIAETLLDTVADRVSDLLDDMSLRRRPRVVVTLSERKGPR